jgi:hypothetical protein
VSTSAAVKWEFLDQIVDGEDSLHLPVKKARFILVPAGREDEARSIRLAFAAGARLNSSLLRDLPLTALQENILKRLDMPWEAHNVEQLEKAKKALEAATLKSRFNPSALR